MPGFQTAYPEIDLELFLDDAAPDFISDRIDVAFRSGQMEDSQVVAKHLVPVRMQLCASPEYAKRHGVPRNIDELAHHRCIQLRLPCGKLCDWEFSVDGHPHRLLPPSARSTFNDDDLILQSVLDGQGIAQLPTYQVCSLLEAGQLVTCLDEFSPDEREHYICYFSRKHLPSRIRVFIDYMAQNIRELHMPPMGLSAAAAWTR
jgi:DNA-binding transcriptional LysR family regulator